MKQYTETAILDFEWHRDDGKHITHASMVDLRLEALKWIAQQAATGQTSGSLAACLRGIGYGGYWKLRLAAEAVRVCVCAYPSLSRSPG